MKNNFNIYNGFLKKIYSCKIDTHIIEIELLNNGNNDFIKVWYNYNNNTSTTELFFNLKNNDYYGANITKRQGKLILKKINQALLIHNKNINNIKK